MHQVWGHVPPQRRLWVSKPPVHVCSIITLRQQFYKSYLMWIKNIVLSSAGILLSVLICWFQFYFLLKKYFKLSALWRIVISACIFLNLKNALAFPIIFLCSCLLFIYLFVAPDDILSYQFSRTKSNNSISVEDHSYVRKDYNFIILYSMKFSVLLVHTWHGPCLLLLYVELILIFNFNYCF